MRRLCLAIVTFAACFAVSARQPQLQVPPAPIAQQLQVEVVPGHEELALVVPQTAMAVGMQFGLVGALIGAAVQDSQEKSAEARIAPLRAMLEGYSFYDRFEDTLHARLASAGISPDPQFGMHSPSWQSDGEGEPESFVLMPRYAMDDDLGQMKVSMTAHWIKRVKKPNGRSELETLFVRSYLYSLPMSTGTRAERGAKWALLGREGLQALMDEAADQLVDMLVYDFSSDGRANWQAKVGKGAFARVNDVGFGGEMVREGPGWVWVRVQIGKEWPMLRGYHPIVASTFALQPNPESALDLESSKLRSGATKLN